MSAFASGYPHGRGGGHHGHSYYTHAHRDRTTSTGSPSVTSQRDPYEVLGIPRDATPAQIKVAYRKLALQHHPDKVQGDEAAKARATKLFVEISAAYEVLTRREEESQHRSDTPNPFAASPFFFPNFGFSFTDPFVLFRNTFGMDDFFGESGSGGASSPFDSFTSSQPNLFARSASSVMASSNWTGGNMGLVPPAFSTSSVSSQYSSSSSQQQVLPDGRVQTTTVTTTVQNGQAVTKTETTTRHADGRIETTVRHLTNNSPLDQDDRQDVPAGYLANNTRQETFGLQRDDENCHDPNAEIPSDDTEQSENEDSDREAPRDMQSQQERVGTKRDLANDNDDKPAPLLKRHKRQDLKRGQAGTIQRQKTYTND